MSLLFVFCLLPLMVLAQDEAQNPEGIFRELDEDKNGKLSLTEFHSAFVVSEQFLIHAFNFLKRQFQ